LREGILFWIAPSWLSFIGFQRMNEKTLNNLGAYVRPTSEQSEVGLIRIPE
jgi:hypothetical protein